MNDFQIKGQILEIFPTEKKSESLIVREFVLLTSEAYPNKIRFQLVQDRVVLLDKWRKGDNVSVKFQIRGISSDKDGKISYFNNLNAWLIE